MEINVDKSEHNQADDLNLIDSQGGILSGTNRNSERRILIFNDKKESKFKPVPEVQSPMLKKQLLERAQVQKTEFDINFLKPKLTFRILQFLRRLKESNTVFKVKIEKAQFQLIRDKASNWENTKRSTNSWFATLLRLGRFLPVIEPNNIFAIICEIISLMFSIVHIIIAPLKLSFGYVPQGFLQSAMGEISYLVFSILMIIKMDMGFYDQNSIEKQRSAILKRYIQSQFFYELSTVIAIKYYDHSQLFFLVIPVVLLRVIMIKNAVKIISEYFKIEQLYPDIFQLTILLFKAAMLAHYCASCFHYIAFYENPGVDTWITKRGTYSYSWQLRYLDSIYFSLITMNTVGYGDITPISSKQQLFVIFMTIIACGFFAYCVNMIGSIFQNMTKKYLDLKQSKIKIKQINFLLLISSQSQKKYYIQTYLNVLKIPQDIQLKIVNYIQCFSEESDSGKMKKGQEILDSIDSDLKKEVLDHFFGSIIKQSRILQQNFSQEFLSSLIQQMHYITLNPGETLYKKNDIDLKYYYINQGQLLVYVENELEKSENILGSISVKYIYLKFKTYKFLIQGRFFGLRGFITSEQRKVSIKSKDVSHLAYIEQDQFIELIQHHKSDFVIQKQKCNIQLGKFFQEMYHQIQQSMLCQTINESYWKRFWQQKSMHQTQKTEKQIINKKFNQNINILLETENSHRQCFLCRQFSHIAIHCPLVTFKVQKQSIISKHLMPGHPIENRQKFERQNNQFNSLNFKGQLQLSLMNYRIEKILESNQIFPEFETFQQEFFQSDVLDLSEIPDQTFFQKMPILKYDERLMVIKPTYSNSPITNSISSYDFDILEEDDDVISNKEDQSQQDTVSQKGDDEKSYQKAILELKKSTLDNIVNEGVQHPHQLSDDSLKRTVHFNSPSSQKSQIIVKSDMKFSRQIQVMDKSPKNRRASTHSIPEVTRNHEMQSSKPSFSIEQGKYSDEDVVPEDNCINVHEIISQDQSQYQEQKQSNLKYIQTTRQKIKATQDFPSFDRNQALLGLTRGRKKSTLFMIQNVDRTNPIKTLVDLQPIAQIQEESMLFFEQIQEFENYFPDFNLRALIRTQQNNFRK